MILKMFINYLLLLWSSWTYLAYDEVREKYSLSNLPKNGRQFWKIVTIFHLIIFIYVIIVL